MILVPCDLIEPEDDNFETAVRGWMRPELPIGKFLKEFSLLGGTHHSCISYKADLDVLRTLGEVMGWNVFEL